MKNPIVKILLGVLVAVIGAIVQWFLWPWVGPSRFILFYPAIMAASLLGGVLAGTSATLASAALATFAFFPKVINYPIKPGLTIPTILFVGVGFIMTYGAVAIRRRTEELAAEKIRRTMDKRVRESERTLAYALEVGELGTWTLDVRTKQAQRSLRHDQIFGYETLLKDWSYDIFMEHVVPEDRTAVSEKFGRALATLNDLHFECRIKRADGVIRWIEAQGKPQAQKNEVIQFVGVVKDITERKKAEEELAILAAIIVSSDDAILSMDLRGIVKSWNSGAQRLLGYTAEELIGHSIKLLLPPERQKEEEEILRRLGSGQRVQHFETVRLTKAQRRVDVSLTISPIVDNRGRIIGASKIIRNITERKKNEKTLIEAKLAAEDAVQARMRFLDIAAHELRTPVTTISLLLQYSEKELKKGRPIDTATMTRLRGQASRLSRLVVDLFDVSRLDHGKFNLRSEPTNIIALSSECVDGFRIQDPQRRFFLSAPHHPLIVEIDPARIFQVLSNLLDNAIKYTDNADPIEVRIDSTPDLIRISVIDHGAGISSEQQKMIFEPLARGTSDQVERTSGLGLGLYISRTIIRLHGGNIGLTSKLGLGSTFYFELPTKSQLKKAA